MSRFRILVTGSREWSDRDTIRTALAQTLADNWGDSLRFELVHGGARGADRIADEVWRQWMRDGYATLADPIVFDANWERYGRRAGMVRNAEMVAFGADACLAFPLGMSVGTRGCMEMARKAGIPLVEFGEGGP